MDELDYQTWQASPHLLDQELCKIKIDGIGDFFTFEKYKNIQADFDGYMARLRELAHFVINPKDIVVDIGGHHGIVALNFARLGAKVFVYEPHPLNLEILKRNTLIHPELDITIEPKAVFEKTTPLEFDFGKTLTTGALVETGRDWKRTGQRISVEAVSFKDILKKHALTNIKLMKIDCEGAEYDFVMKASREDLRVVQFFFMEVHPTSRFVPEQLFSFMKDSGYEVMAYPVHHGCFDLVCRRI